MLLAQKQSEEVVRSRDFDLSAYHVTLSGAAAKILHDGIYSGNKRHLAAMREIANNAVDAHVAAGKADVPIRVHLPTEAEPTFRVTDEGVGLSADEVRDLFGGYFSSRTRESREGTGCFGLGAKAPFAYTTQFTISAVKEGLLSVFSAYMNGDGVPEMALMRYGETDKPNGVSVEFAVRNEDLCQFVRDGLSLFNAFRVLPELDVAEHAEALRTLRAHLEEMSADVGQGWRLVSHFSDWRIDGIGNVRLLGGHSRSEYRNLVIMGHVAYPLDMATLIDEADEQWLGEDKAAIRHLSNLVLELDIATEPVGVHPSRERLSYTPVTVRRLVGRIRSFLAEYRTRYAVSLESMSQWDKVAYANDLLQERPRWVRAALGLGTDETITLDYYGTYKRLESGGARLSLISIAPEASSATDTRIYKPDDDAFLVRPSRHTLVVVQNGGKRVRDAAVMEAIRRRDAMAETRADGTLRRRGMHVLLVRPGPRVSEREAFGAETEWFLGQMGHPAALYSADLWKAHKGSLAADAARRHLCRVTVSRSVAPSHVEFRHWDFLGEREREGLLDASMTAVALFRHRKTIMPCAGDAHPRLVRALAAGGHHDESLIAQAVADIDADARIVMVRPSDSHLLAQFGHVVPAGDFLIDWLMRLDEATLARLRTATLRTVRRKLRQCARFSESWIDYGNRHDMQRWRETLDSYREHYGESRFPTALRHFIAAEARMRRFYGHRYDYHGHGQGLSPALMRVAERLAVGRWPLEGADHVPALADLGALSQRFAERLESRYGTQRLRMGEVFTTLNRGAFHALLRDDSSACGKLVRLLHMERLCEDAE